MRYTVAQLVEALGGFDSRRGHWDPSSNRNKYLEYLLGEGGAAGA